MIEITGGGTDTTYDLASAQNGTDVDITLTGSDATTDTVTLVAGDAITLTDDGSNNVTIATDGTAESTHIAVKNTSGSTITKGTPVYITGNVGASDRLEIAPADASDAAKMPAVGLLETDLANNGEGFVVQGGYLRNITTSTIDGTSTSSNDTVYVKAGGGLTMTKPTGSTNYIQNIAKVARVGTASDGSLIVSSILRTNDVPNLSTGKIWVGDGNTIESTVVHLDEANSRMGINTTSPTTPLHIADDSPSIRLQDNTSSDNHYLTGNNGEFRIQTSGYLSFRPNNTEQVVITSTGAVGIDTSNPSAKLQIGDGSSYSTLFYANDANIKTRFSGTTDQSQEGIWVFKNTGTWGQTRFYIEDANNLDSRLTLDIKGNQGSTDILAATSTGKIGIGTTSPSAELHIYGSNSGASGVASGTLIIEQGSAPSIQILSANTQTQSIKFGDPQDGDVGRIEYSHANNEMTFVTNGSDALTIDNSQNIGIGTTSPSGRLHIKNSASSTYALRFAYSDGTDGGGFYESTSTDLSLFLKDSTGTTKTSITSAGDSYFTGGSLGIGTSSPSAFTGYTTLTLNNATNGAILNLKVNEVETGRIQAYSGILNIAAKGATTQTTFETNSTERMRITD